MERYQALILLGDSINQLLSSSLVLIAAVRAYYLVYIPQQGGDGESKASDRRWPHYEERHRV